MGKIKIAVIGSCVSRDNFNSHFVENYKEFYQCVDTQNHMSIISLVSKAIPFQPHKLEGDITDFNKQILMTELTKGIWDSLRVQQPDYLIIDLYADVYFGVLKVNDSYITNKSTLFRKTPFFSTLPIGESLSVDENFIEYTKLWESCIDIFMTAVKNEFPSMKIILNKVHFTDNYIDKKSNEIKKISESGQCRKVNVKKINQYLDNFYHYIESNYSIEVINYEKEYYSLDNHHWDLFYVHFTNDFYKDFTTKLLKILLKDLYLYKKKDKEATHIAFTKNLLKNPSFTLGRTFWTHWQDDFKVLPPELDSKNSNIVTIRNCDLSKDVYRQIWSHPIIINADGIKEFKLSFDIKTTKKEYIDSLQFVFSIRAFNKIDHVTQAEAQWFKNIKTTEIGNLSNDEWVNYSIIVKPPRGKFIKIGPYLLRNGEVFWRNISFTYVN